MNFGVYGFGAAVLGILTQMYEYHGIMH